MGKHSTTRKRRKRGYGTERYTSKEYRPYVMAIGQVALAWNDLNESLGSLFVTMVGFPGDFKLQAAWQSLVSDRSKRDMLKAAIKEMDASEIRGNPKAKEEMKWLFGQLERLEIERNHVIHAPLASFSDPIWRLFPSFGRPEGIAPDDVRGNRLAAKLKGKNLLTEYRFIRDDAIILRDYVSAIEDGWNPTEKRRTPWPERPRLPNRGQKSPRKARRSDSPKQLRLLPEASQE